MRSYEDLCADDARVAFPMFQSEYGGSIPTSALQLHVCKISRERFKELNQKWHSRLPVTTNCWNGVCFGAEHGNIFYAVAWWSHPIAQNRLKDGKQLYELRRMAISEEAPKNTASRFLSIMTKVLHRELPRIIRLISYQDTEVHTGTIYKASGWTPNLINCDHQSWENRKGRSDQSKAPKIRWEKNFA